MPVNSNHSSSWKQKYPHAKKGNVVEDFHAIKVYDPYRWLEDANNPNTKTWVESQNKLVKEFLETDSNFEKKKLELDKLHSYPIFTNPKLFNSSVYYLKKGSNDLQAKLCRKKGSSSSEEVLFDPIQLDEQGLIAITQYGVSQDEQFLSFSLTRFGSDRQTVRIFDLRAQKLLPEILSDCRFTPMEWTQDTKGFFYVKFAPKSNTSGKIYYHKLYTEQNTDKLIFAGVKEEFFLANPQITDDNRFLVITVVKDTTEKTMIFILNLDDLDSHSITALITEFRYNYSFIGNRGNDFYFLTNDHADFNRIIKIDLNRPNESIDVIQQQKFTIEQAVLSKDYLVISRLEDVCSVVKIYDLQSTFIRNMDLPDYSSVDFLFARQTKNIVAFNLGSFLQPDVIYYSNLETNQSTILEQVEQRLSEDIIIRQVFFPSKDQTLIPMFVFHNKSVTQNKSNPTILYGYGGFHISLKPSYSVFIHYWIEHGGVFAQANLRGGNEYGEQWYQAGSLLNKQNTFDDFISAAEWLINNNYTNSSRLVSYGRSNGGLLVAATMLQRSELFGAVLCQVPVIDMLRYHKFTIGSIWINDYGDPANFEQFKVLYSYSPLHNITEGMSYPPILTLIAESDDRVLPAHGKKFVATLQEKDAGQNPILLFVDTKAGHGYGRPKWKIVHNQALVFSFLDKFLS